ncbi:MAG: RsmE family RNA methyltransferase, partial [Verrucomicrobiaceae bacterium]
MARFYLPPDAWSGSPALTGDEARHLSQVLRGKAGERITVFDGRGRRAAATVKGVSKDHIPLELGEPVISASTGPAIILAQAIPKGKNMDFIVQKAVELGVSAIQPLVTANTIVQPGEGKSEKWRRVALEACKQCGQDTLPEIAEPMPYAQWISLPSGGDDVGLIASLAPGARPFRDILRGGDTPRSVTYLVGPEGDFTAPGALIALLGLLLAVGLQARKVPGAILWAILLATVAGIPFGVTHLPEQWISLPHSVAPLLGKVDLIGAINIAFLPFLFIFFASEFFSTMGTTLAVGGEAGLLDEHGNMKHINRPFMVDSVAAALGPPTRAARAR